MINKINLDPFMGKINGYKLSFFGKSTVGRLLEQNGDYITIELKDGNVIITHIDSLVSIWPIRAKQKAIQNA
jgi:hypothetical protein